MGEDTPTVRLDAAEPEPEKKRERSKTLILLLAIVGLLLLIAVVVLLTLIFSGALNKKEPATQPGANGSSQSQSPSPSEEPSSSPSESPSETPSASPSSAPSAPPAPPAPPAETGPRFKTFSFPASQSCSAGGPGFPATRPEFKVSWTTAGADEAWFVNGTDDAANSGYMQIPLNGNQSAFPYEQIVDCSDGSNTYTITLVGPDGKHVSKTWTVAITGDHF